MFLFDLLHQMLGKSYVGNITQIVCLKSVQVFAYSLPSFKSAPYHLLNSSIISRNELWFVIAVCIVTFDIFTCTQSRQ